MQENLLRFKAHLEHSNSWFRYGKGTQTLAIDVNADLNVIEQSQFIIAANPHLAFDGEYYKLHLGFRVDAKTNSISMGGIYPDIKGSLYLFQRNIEFYAGLGGMTKINTLKEILEENPFVVSNPLNYAEFDYEKTWIDFQGGLKFKALNMVNGHLGIRYRGIENHIFFINSITQAGTFDVILNNCYIFNFNACPIVINVVAFLISASRQPKGYEYDKNADQKYCYKFFHAVSPIWLQFHS
jgi:hypothetical protein